MDVMKRLLFEAKIYVVLDRQVNDYDQLFEIIKQVSQCGVGIFQIRDKFGSSKDILQFSKCALSYLKGKIPFIVNDRVDLALASCADGVHLGQDDLSVTFARKMLGLKKVIGVSCQTLQQALNAQQEGADYIGFGSVFKTLTKPDRNAMDLKLLTSVAREINIPVFPIGGINLGNIHHIRDAGIKRVALTRAICSAEEVEFTTRRILEALES